VNIHFGAYSQKEHEDILASAKEIGAAERFQEWLAKNPQLVHEFFVLADMTRNKGRTAWSADAVLHVLRWFRAVRDAADPVFKINNNWSAGMGRLYNAMRGVEFFRVRTSSGVYT
jgi:hypothetical protein